MRAERIAALQHNLPSLLTIKSERSRRSFRHFFEHFAWPALLPGVRFDPNWHIDAICEHLQAVAAGQIKRLVINMPFRQLKSTIVSQAFQAWEWIESPWLHYLTASYARDLAIRDAVATRRIIESPAYRVAFGDSYTLSTDQNVKSRYENNKGGTRIVTSTDSAAVGFGGNRRIVDDPIDPRSADSEVAIENGIEWWKGTMSTRANDPERDAVIVVHQRINQRDLTGYLLANEPGWDQLILPMRYESEYSRTTSIGWRDPRKVEGELLMPARLGEEAVKSMERSLGVYHTKAQLQQRPDPRGGVIFERSKWQFWKALPELDEIAISVDCAFKALATSDRVAIHVWGCKGANKYLIYRRWEQLTFTATCKAIETVTARFGDYVACLVEDKANGPAVVDSLKGKISALIEVTPEGGKASRAFAMTPELDAGNIFLPDPSIDPDIEVFLGAASSFTGAEGGQDDEVDSMTQYFAWRKKREAASGLQRWMAEQAASNEQAAPGSALFPLMAAS